MLIRPFVTHHGDYWVYTEVEGLQGFTAQPYEHRPMVEGFPVVITL